MGADWRLFYIRKAGNSRIVDPGIEFPSLEHGRLTFPRPKPTLLNPVISQNRKGKGKAVLDSEEDPDWTPDYQVPISEGKDHAVSGPKHAKTSSQKTYQTSSNTTDPKNTRDNPCFERGLDRNEDLDSVLKEGSGSGGSNLEATVAEHTRSIARLTVMLTKSNAKVEALESELRTLSGLFKKFMRESKDHEDSASKTGGRIAVSSACWSPASTKISLT